MNPNLIRTNPHSAHSRSLLGLIFGIWQHRKLILQMTKREVIGRYKGSAIGLAWSFFNPLFMLAVYTVVFSMIFKARWGGADIEESKTQFALILFVGMIALNLFIEVINKSPHLIVSNVNYVKKVVFPLEILPIISIAAAIFHALISYFVLLVAFFVFNGFLNPTALLMPVVFLPMITLSLGMSWILASLGVFVRDVAQTIGLLTTLLIFLSPVFYPIAAVPARLQPFIMANPLTFIIEQSRTVVIWGSSPDWTGLMIYGLISLLLAWVGYAWFQMTRKGFADVL